MNGTKAFTPLGKTFVIPSDTVAPTGVQVSTIDAYANQSACAYRIVNSGAVVVHLGWGPSAAIATANAVAATAGSPTNSLVIGPGATEIFTFGPNAYFSALSASAVSVYITVGEGI